VRIFLAWLGLITAFAAGPALAQAKTEKPAGEGEVAALILAGEESTLSSQMAGKISSVRVGLGDVFKEGEALIEFDCAEQRAQLQAADAEYRAARETHLARLRLQALGAAGELDVTLAAAASEKARSQVDYRRTQIAYCRVRAPFRGNVARMRVKAAESVPAGQALIDVVNTNSLKAQMFVPAAWVAWLRPGTRLTIHVKEIGQSFPARVSRMNSRVDGVSQQLEVEARVDKGGGDLLPGMVGAAVFTQERKP
jgi:membrane fusion protein, multidrug efflux system